MDSKSLLLFTIMLMIVISYSANVFAESEDNSEAAIPSVFAKEDYITP